MEKAPKSGPEAAASRPEDGQGGAFGAVEASDKAALGSAAAERAGLLPDVAGGPAGRAKSPPEVEASPGPTPAVNPPAPLPSAGFRSGRLAALAETAKAYARSAQADN